MRHHFADFLDKENDYWTIVPNVERYSYSLDTIIDDNSNVKIATLNKNDRNWKQVFDFPNIEEITLDEPNKEQVESLNNLTNIKRLRISFLRITDIEFISNLTNLEELVLEYVSGFSDLSPLRKLTKLKSLHFENLRKVSNFDGLKGINNLKYLKIDGTLDWNQPIENFSFLEGLPNLEVLALGFIMNKSDYPAFLPALNLYNLKQIKIGMATFDTKEYAFLETAFPKVKCLNFGNTLWTPLYQINDESTEFIGKGKRKLNLGNPNYENKIAEFLDEYENYKMEAREILKNYFSS
ncbi:leucine-rich repeat domain-containing protein [Chryseobacterium sp. KACC 21268]|nr:leucine-rich repeat domain-containing protein [Chryseobacterium sp. KACC 21268]